MVLFYWWNFMLNSLNFVLFFFFYLKRFKINLKCKSVFRG